MDPRSRTPEQLVRDLVRRVFNGHEVSAADDLLAEGYIQHNPLVPTGRAGFKEHFAHVFETLPDFRYYLHRCITAGALVAIRADIAFTHTGPVLGIAPTGREVRFGAADFFRVEDGWIQEHWDVVDRLDTWIGLGLVRPTQEDAR